MTLVRRLLLVAVVTSVLPLLGSAPARATWSSSGGGAAAGRAVTMPAGQAPTASVRGTDVVVRWPAATVTDGTPVAGYRVERYPDSGPAVPAGAGCAGPITATTCVEHDVPPGTWVYVDVPVQDSWTGTASPGGQAVDVSGSACRPARRARPAAAPC